VEEQQFREESDEGMLDPSEYREVKSGVNARDKLQYFSKYCGKVLFPEGSTVCTTMLH